MFLVLFEWLVTVVGHNFVLYDPLKRNRLIIKGQRLMKER